MNSSSELACLADDESVVQQIKRLCGKRAAVAFAGDGGGIWEIKRSELGRHRIAQHEKIHAAMSARQVQRWKLVDEHIAMLDEGPDGRLWIQLACGEKHGVANGFRIKATAQMM